MSAESRLGRFVEGVRSMFKKDPLQNRDLKAWQAEALLKGLVEGKDVVTGEVWRDGAFVDTAIIVDGEPVTPPNKTLSQYLQDLKGTDKLS